MKYENTIAKDVSCRCVTRLLCISRGINLLQIQGKTVQ